MALPRTILCVGRNYSAHALELSNPIPTTPFFFLKPSSSITLTGPILVPPGASLHHEIELAVVLGRRTSRVKSDEEAMQCVKGYRLAVDVTARNWQNEAKRAGLPWTRAKGCDTFLPLGAFVGKEEVGDPHDVELVLRVNGKVMQCGNTREMITRIPGLIRYASMFMTLEEGDLILTGTPSGVGTIVPGDRVEVSGLGNGVAGFDVAEWE